MRLGFLLRPTFVISCMVFCMVIIPLAGLFLFFCDSTAYGVGSFQLAVEFTNRPNDETQVTYTIVARSSMVPMLVENDPHPEFLARPIDFGSNPLSAEIPVRFTSRSNYCSGSSYRQPEIVLFRFARTSGKPAFVAVPIPEPGQRREILVRVPHGF